MELGELNHAAGRYERSDLSFGISYRPQWPFNMAAT